MRPVLLSLLCVSTLSLAADPAPSHGLAYDATLRAIFADLLRSGGHGLRETETAAFIVMDRDGYRCIEWPYTGEIRRQTWQGAAPPFTVAIAHTHHKSSRRPSRGDVKTAGAVGVPVFVLTPSNIWVATPEGATVAVVEGRQWAPAIAARAGCIPPSPASPPRMALSAE